MNWEGSGRVLSWINLSCPAELTETTMIPQPGQPASGQWFQPPTDGKSLFGSQRSLYLTSLFRGSDTPLNHVLPVWPHLKHLKLRPWRETQWFHPQNWHQSSQQTVTWSRTPQYTEHCKNRGSPFTTGLRSRIFGCKSNRRKMSTI